MSSPKNISTTSVTVSSKYEVSIPREIGDSLGIRPGTKMQMFQFGDRIECIPCKNIKTMRGFLKGMSTEFDRDENPLF